MAAAVLSKEKSSLRSYLSQFKKWRSYCEDSGCSVLPADSFNFANFLLDSTRKLSHQVIKQVIASVNFFS